MFGTVKDFPFLQPLIDNWETIRDEYLKTPEGVPWHEKALYNEGWTVFGFHMNGMDVEAGRLHCPKTYELVKSIPGLFLAGFSILEPGCEIYPHVGYTDKVWRSHLGLICPPGAWIRVGGDMTEWRDGELFVFDDSLNHWAANPTDQKRVVLIVDFVKGEPDA